MTFVTSATSAITPTVTVAIPALDVAGYLEACLAAIDAQNYPAIVEVLVVDGGSIDATREIALRHEGVTVLENPRRIRPAAMNVALAEAKGDVLVRVDARTVIATDYVERCVKALVSTGATMVGGPMRLAASSPATRGIAAAMASRLGGGPAAFRRDAGRARFVDTVYLGAYFVEAVRTLGGYDEHFGGNEDAELAFRAKGAGGVFLDPTIRSSYAVREGLSALASQYFRYGRARAGTIRKHPRSLSLRQLAVPALMIGIFSPWRRSVLGAYGLIVTARGAVEAWRDPTAAATVVAALPVMHGAWGAGFIGGMTRHRRRL